MVKDEEGDKTGEMIQSNSGRMRTPRCQSPIDRYTLDPTKQGPEAGGWMDEGQVDTRAGGYEGRVDGRTVYPEERRYRTAGAPSAQALAVRCDPHRVGEHWGASET